MMKTTVALSLLALGGATAFAVALPGNAEATGPACLPINGQFEAVTVPPAECDSPVGFCTRGTLTGALRGTYEFVMDSATPADPRVPGITSFTGVSEVMTKRGATLTGIDTGTIDLNPPDAEGNFVSLITFQSATDYLEGATGQIALRGKSNLASGTTKGDFRGQLCW